MQFGELDVPIGKSSNVTGDPIGLAKKSSDVGLVGDRGIIWQCVNCNRRAKVDRALGSEHPFLSSSCWTFHTLYIFFELPSSASKAPFFINIAWLSIWVDSQY